MTAEEVWARSLTRKATPRVGRTAVTDLVWAMLAEKAILRGSR